MRPTAQPEAEQPLTARPESPHDEVGRAIALAEAALRKKDSGEAKSLRAAIERVIGPRGQWSAATCRVLADRLLDLAEACALSEQHELAWLRLLGWCLRPGFGVDGDGGRIDRMWAVRATGLRFPSKANWAQWWITWRWVAAGLDRARQLEQFAELRPWLWRDADGKPPAGPHKHGPMEMLQLAAVLERIDADAKRELGELLFARADKLGSFWPIGRVGSREPFCGQRGDVVDPATAEAWIQRLCALDLASAEGASFAIAQIARKTGDAARDVNAAVRQQAADRLARAKAPSTWVEMVVRGADFSDSDRGRMFGESLPAGLRLGA